MFFSVCLVKYIGNFNHLTGEIAKENTNKMETSSVLL